MLPSGHRMRRRDEFTLTVRRGRRAGRSTVVVHLLRRDEAAANPPRTTAREAASTHATSLADAPGGPSSAGVGAPGSPAPDARNLSVADSAARGVAGDAPGYGRTASGKGLTAPNNGRTAPGNGGTTSDGVAAELTPRVGFIVARTVGNAVVRNKVRRMLRHLVAGHIDRLPRGSLLVVRANPAAASARNDQLAADLESALDRLTRPRSEGRT